MCNFTTKDSWVILSPIEQSIKQKIEAAGIPLKDWNISINYGIKTGFNDAFIISGAKRDEILANCKTDEERHKTAELIRPILRGRDIKRYSYNWADLWLIYIPWHFPLQWDQTIQGASEKAEYEFQKQYPAVYSHLLKYKKELSARNKAETGIRYEWYAMQRWGANYWEDFNKPYIAWIELTDESKFTYCENMVALNTVFFLNGEKLFDILGMLNSKLILYYFKNCLGTTSGVGTNRWLKFTIEKLPLVHNTPKELEDLVKRRLKSSENNEFYSNLDEEINLKVYELYGLTDEEIDFIQRI